MAIWKTFSRMANEHGKILCMSDRVSWQAFSQQSSERIASVVKII